MIHMHRSKSNERIKVVGVGYHEQGSSTNGILKYFPKIMGPVVSGNIMTIHAIPVI